MAPEAFDDDRLLALANPDDMVALTLVAGTEPEKVELRLTERVPKGALFFIDRERLNREHAEMLDTFRSSVRVPSLLDWLEGLHRPPDRFSADHRHLTSATP